MRSYEIIELSERDRFISFKVYLGREMRICNVANFAPKTWEHPPHITQAVEEFITHHFPEDQGAGVPEELRGQRRVN